jgi:histidyl-tRNA synthetase
MSNGSTKPPSGTRDFLPQDVMRRRHVVSVIQRIYEAAGFVPLETPAYENLSTLLGKCGDEGDQLLFRLLKRRDALDRVLDGPEVNEGALADLGLRYDLTVPLARVVAQYRDLPRFFKRYQIQPVWRADRPGRGRFREFYQCDVDIIGTTDLIAEAEVLSSFAQVLQELGFKDFTLRLNHRQLLRSLIESAGISADKEATALVAVDKLDKIGRDGVLAELESRAVGAPAANRLLELLVSGVEAGQGYAAQARELRRLVQDEAGKHAADELCELCQLLDATPAAGKAAICPDLARGLSYYTGPIFEVTVSDLAGSLGGGGRYDNLVGMFTKQEIPAVGGSLGLERILLVMEQRQMYPVLPIGAELMLCWVDVDRTAILSVAHRLRRQGLRVEVYPQETKLSKQLQYADSPAVKVPVVAILGGSELAQDRLTLKHLVRGEQISSAIDAVAVQLAAWAEGSSSPGAAE